MMLGGQRAKRVHALFICPDLQDRRDEVITDPDESDDVNCPTCVKHLDQLRGAPGTE